MFIFVVNKCEYGNMRKEHRQRQDGRGVIFLCAQIKEGGWFVA
jgi:hypothetical protein